MLQNLNCRLIGGSKFSKFRPTALSVAMAEANLIPGTHVVAEREVAVVRERNDMTGLRRSVAVVLQ